jgi:iron-sulfur cluster assembly accessory protein
LTTPTTEPVDDDSVRSKNLAGVTLTAAAIEKVRTLLGQEGRDDLRLRVAVQPGGCSGLRYQLFFDDRLFDGDHITRYGDVDEGVSESDRGYDSGYESGPE